MFHYFRIISIKINSIFSKVIISFFCLFDKNVKISKGCKFVGLPIFRPLPGSRIAIGENCFFNSSGNSNLIGINRKCMLSTLSKNAEIIIKDNCGFSGSIIASYDKIIIKQGTKCGANTLITDTDWHLDDPRAGIPKAVIVGENVWIGEGVKILKGVVIGDNTVIGAGSVVTKSIPADVIAAGNPCKIIRNIGISE